MLRHTATALTVTLTTLGLTACADVAPEEPAPEAPAPESTVTETVYSNPPETGTPTRESPATEDSGDCDPSALARDIDPALDVVTHCNGQWLRGGKDQTDWIIYAQWENGQWNKYPAHGESFTGFPCYHPEQARKDGAPEGIVAQMLACT